MISCDKSLLHSTFEGKTVAVVGGGPTSLKNEAGLIDSHDVVVRVNNYKLFEATGKRTDVYYSYFGGAIRKTPEELKNDGVRLCICKCPNEKFIESEWHRKHGKMNGVDFRYIYKNRESWWFCDTYVTLLQDFLDIFNVLGRHIPTTGFNAIYEVLKHNPKSVYITGFDFFESGIHNVDERWNKMNLTDPIGHRPEIEKKWLIENLKKFPIVLDKELQKDFYA